MFEKFIMVYNSENVLSRSHHKNITKQFEVIRCYSENHPL